MIDLFGNPIPEPDKNDAPRKAELAHTQLVKIYGAVEGKMCRECVHFHRLWGNKYSIFKCKLAKDDGTEKTDWRAKWVACGRFEQNHNAKKSKKQP